MVALNAKVRAKLSFNKEIPHLLLCAPLAEEDKIFNNASSVQEMAQSLPMSPYPFLFLLVFWTEISSDFKQWAITQALCSV